MTSPLTTTISNMNRPYSNKYREVYTVLYMNFSYDIKSQKKKNGVTGYDRRSGGGIWQTVHGLVGSLFFCQDFERIQ